MIKMIDATCVVDLLAIRENGFGENWREFERSWKKTCIGS